MASPKPAPPITSPTGSRARPLVIGIGNLLRGDDAVGPMLATRVSGRCVHQLTPELAAELAPLERVLFIDAWLAPAGAVPRLDPLQPSTGAGEMQCARYGFGVLAQVIGPEIFEAFETLAHRVATFTSASGGTSAASSAARSPESLRSFSTFSPKTSFT